MKYCSKSSPQNGLVLQAGETRVTQYPYWTQEQAQYIISIINLGYEPGDVEKFIDEMHHNDPGRVEDLHAYLKNRKVT